MAKRKPKPKAKAKPKVRNLGGRPPHQPTPESHKLAQQLLGLGTKQKDVALIMGISKTTLEKHYPKEIEHAAIQVNAQVKTNLFAMTKHNVAAAIFWLKNRESDDWKDKHDVGVTGKLSLEDLVNAAHRRVKGKDEKNG